MNYLFSLEILHQYLHCSVTIPRPKTKSVVIHFCTHCFLLKVANYICKNKPFVWLSFSFPHHRFHPLKSRYIALPCDYFFSYLKYDSASVEDNFYKIILVLCFLLWGYPSPLFNTQVIWISVCLALRVSTAFLRLHTKSNWWLLVSRSIHRLLRPHLTSIIAKFWPHKILQILKHTCMSSFLLSRLLLI